MHLANGQANTATYAAVAGWLAFSLASDLVCSVAFTIQITACDLAVQRVRRRPILVLLATMPGHWKIGGECKQQDIGRCCVGT
jgi:hypothetical protein